MYKIMFVNIRRWLLYVHVSFLYYNCSDVIIYILYQRTKNVNYFYCQVSTKLVIQMKTENKTKDKEALIEIVFMQSTSLRMQKPHRHLIEKAFFLNYQTMHWNGDDCIVFGDLPASIVI